MDPELDPRSNRAPGLPRLQHRLIVGKHALKDCAILKHEHTSAMLLLKLPLPLVLGTCGVVQGAIAMPLPILELPLIPTLAIDLYLDKQAASLWHAKQTVCLD